MVSDLGLSGEMLKNPRKLVLMILFSFESDTLEIGLHDWLDLVDYVFIVEATKTHKGVSIVLYCLVWSIIMITAGYQASYVGKIEISGKIQVCQPEQSGACYSG